MTTYRLCERVAVVDRPGHHAIYVAQLPDGPVLTLNGMGALVWELVIDGLEERDVVARLADATGEPAPVVASGVRDFVEQLRRARVIREVGPGR